MRPRSRCASRVGARLGNPGQQVADVSCGPSRGRRMFRYGASSRSLAPGHFGRRGASIPVMPRSLRKLIALVAAYSIALQVLFLGFMIGPQGLAGPHEVFASLAIFCGGKNTGDAPRQHDNGCGACAFACGAGSLLAVLPGSKPALPLLADQAVASPFPAPAPQVPAKHRPQTSRAPPAIG
jgi:hypothetical protein